MDIYIYIFVCVCVCVRACVCARVCVRESHHLHAQNPTSPHQLPSVSPLCVIRRQQTKTHESKVKLPPLKKKVTTILLLACRRV